MHLKSLHIKNFRTLEDFQVSKLGRVNLIVGKNNSGKSSVLEALRIYAGNANPNLLEEIAFGHDEKYRVNDGALADYADIPFVDFFSGRLFPLDDESSILIGEVDDEPQKTLEIKHFLMGMAHENVERDGEARLIERPIILSKYAVAHDGVDYDMQALIVSKNGNYKLLNLDSLTGRRPRQWFEASDGLPSSYIPTQFISMDELADLWDQIQFSEHGDFVREGLKLIADDFEHLAFVKAEPDLSRAPQGLIARTMSSNLRRTAMVKLRSMNKPIPLNSMGDGMLRVLQLLLKIFPAKGGFLLIDEFENGLHYSAQEKIWRHLFDLAEKLNIQIFATTHSWDCIESFAKVAVEKMATEGVLFRVGRSVRTSDKGKVIATVFDEQKLFNITQSDVEVR